MKLAPQQIAWLKGLEMAIGGAIGSALLQGLTAGLPTNKQGWMKFGGIVLGSAYAAVRVYVMQSPLSAVQTAEPAKPVENVIAAPSD